MSEHQARQVLDLEMGLCLGNGRSAGEAQALSHQMVLDLDRSKLLGQIYLNTRAVPLWFLIAGLSICVNEKLVAL